MICEDCGRMDGHYPTCKNIISQIRQAELAVIEAAEQILEDHPGATILGFPTLREALDRIKSLREK